MNERKCLWCNRWQSEHEGMTFASQDRWCKCSICLQKRGKSPRSTSEGQSPGEPAFVRVRGNRMHGKDNRS